MMRQSMGKPDVRTFVGCFRRAAPHFLSGSLAAFLLVLLSFGSGTAAQPKALAEELGIPRIMAVANKVRGTQDEEAMRGFFARAGLPVLGVIPVDEMVLEADRLGKAPLDHDVASPAMVEITRLVDTLTPN